MTRTTTETLAEQARRVELRGGARHFPSWLQIRFSNAPFLRISRATIYRQAPHAAPDVKENTMAGHSQYANIMHRKGKQDAKRSKLFSKLAREITVAAKMGLPDPNMNARLRAAIIAARAENMPKDNIDRAIKKASGADGENYEYIRYEGCLLYTSDAADE